MLLSVPLFSQNYYWYKDKQQPLYIDSTRINVTTKVETDLELLLTELPVVEVNLIERTKNNTLLYSVQLSSSQNYISIINYLNTRNEIINISPYFGREGNSTGTSSFFAVKLRNAEDYNLLVSFASEKNLDIVRQVSFMPLWYVLSATTTQYNSVELSNFAYETNLFANVDPYFMIKYEPSCSNEPLFFQQWGLHNNDPNGVDINLCNAWNNFNKKGENTFIPFFSFSI